uniref:Chalcone isomerase domain-containing protein n=1 Tax=Hemiselmis andersenii TaxID=464988 RepID=A0A6U4UE85_HEMAN
MCGCLLWRDTSPDSCRILLRKRGFQARVDRFSAGVGRFARLQDTMKLSISLLCVLVTAACTGTSALAFDKSGNALEPASSTAYPLVFQGHELAGTAIRVKKIAFVPIQVYAVGLYVDPKSLGELKAWKARSHSDLSKDSALFRALLKDNKLTKTLRLVMVRTVTGEQMGSAISEAVESRLPHNQDGECKQAFAGLKGMFSAPSLKTGTEILFRWSPGGKLGVTMDGKDAGLLSSEALAASLFDVFLGEKAVVERAALIERLPDLLAG